MSNMYPMTDVKWMTNLSALADSTTIGTLLCCVLFINILYVIGLGIYRLYLSPLALIPGDNLAALTGWYETYYEIVKDGQFFRAIDKMHKKYGPIVRIGPNEVHFDDPEFIDILYPNSGRKTDKPDFVALRAGTPGSIVATEKHDVHRQRRNALSSFFSNASVRRMEPSLRDHVERMLARLHDFGRSHEVVELHHMMIACASDIVTLHAFGESFRFLDQPDFGRSYFAASGVLLDMTHIFAAVPWLAGLAVSTPGWLAKKMNPALSQFVDRKDWWINKVREIRESTDPDRAKNSIFGGILSSSLPAEEKADHRLTSEAQLVVFAGENTTAYTLTSAIFQILAHPDILQKIRQELASVVTDRHGIPTFAQLDQLHYLNAVINETIRVHPGAMHRQVRVSPEEPIIYTNKRQGKTYTVPPGTIYAISAISSHFNQDAFDNPYQFRPERWLEQPEIAKGFVGFSRGARGCIGMALARRELVMILGSLFLNYDLYNGQDGPTLELYDTLRYRDIDPVRDYVTPKPMKGSKGLRVIVRN
ncbi:cytochrome P450 [Cadophora sp. MPI-SDFR-AT-0126]|nr:cytochrome P450 [Leotiomycetes sp. MPI-SDFR-AT-0126]